MAQMNNAGIPAWLALLSEALQRPVECEHGGRCMLAFDGGLRVDVGLLDGGQEGDDLMVMQSEINPAAGVPQPYDWRLALLINHGGLPPHFSLAMDPLTGYLVLTTLDYVDRLSPGVVVERLNGFIETVPRLLQLAQEDGLANASMPVAQSQMTGGRV